LRAHPPRGRAGAMRAAGQSPVRAAPAGPSLQHTIAQGGHYRESTLGLSRGCPLRLLVGALYRTHRMTLWATVGWTTGTTRMTCACARRRAGQNVRPSVSYRTGRNTRCGPQTPRKPPKRRLAPIGGYGQRDARSFPEGHYKAPTEAGAGVALGNESFWSSGVCCAAVGVQSGQSLPTGSANLPV
jgi:hypothetical protein